MQLQLRDYQRDALEKILGSYHKGIHKQVAVLATGLGKTVIFSHLISHRIETTGKKALIVAHREELLKQARDKLGHVNPTLKIGIEQAEGYADHSSDNVVIASVATIGKLGSKRLAKFKPNEYGTIIIDEAHHASAASYKNILNHFGVLKDTNNWNNEILLLGVTATPKRNDNQGIEQVFDEVTFEYNIVHGIKSNWLSDIRAFRVDTDTNIQKVKTTAGDFATNELEKAVNTKKRNALVVKTYLEEANNKQALVFAVDVAHTKALYEEFGKSGIKVAYVTGETPKNERQTSLQEFAEGKINVMVNAMVLTEGYDNASIAFVLMARPTQSGILYQQMIGRGTRRHKDKKHLTIVDFVDNTSNHTLKTAASLIGIDQDINFRGQDILEGKSQIDELLKKRPYIDLKSFDMNSLRYSLEEVDLLEKEVKERREQPFIWHPYAEGMRLFTADGTTYYLVESLTGQFWVYKGQGQDREYVNTFVSKREATLFVEGLISQDFFKNPPQLSTSPERWENDLPSEAQTNYLRVLGVDEKEIMFMTKGQASRMISELKKSRKI